MTLGRRGLMPALLAVAVPGRGHAQPGAAPAARQRAEFWFDPTQLPGFTGTVERYLPNPQGQVDALMFREGPQVVFPPDLAPAIQKVAPVGRPILVWGIRARTAPVITMLAFAPDAETAPVVVERFYWQLSGRRADAGAVPLEMAGTVRQPYYTPQGEIAGAILDTGNVVILPDRAAAAFAPLLQPGQRLVAVGKGQDGPAGRALLAEQLGPELGALRPVPSAEPPR